MGRKRRLEVDEDSSTEQKKPLTADCVCVEGWVEEHLQAVVRLSVQHQQEPRRQLHHQSVKQSPLLLSTSIQRVNLTSVCKTVSKPAQHFNPESI